MATADSKTDEQSALTPVEKLADEIRRELVHEYRSSMLWGEDLARVLGYGSVGSLRQAIKHRTVAVPLFPLDKRRGKYALIMDVAAWIAKQRVAAGPLTDGTK
jgi:hypothetical protein